MTASRWATRSEVVEALRKRWQRGEFLTALADDRPVVPQSVPLRAPTAREVADRFGEVQDWVRRWEADGSGLRLEYTTVGGRLIGANRLPGRAWVDEEDRLWRLLGVRSEVAAFRQVLARTRAAQPELEPWVRDHPLAALAEAEVWDRLLAVVRWIAEHGGPGVYLRQIDVPGVDTKFVESRRGLLGELLDAVLPEERVERAVPYRRFAERYRMAAKPAYLRCRSLDGRPLLAAGGPSGSGPSGGGPSGGGPSSGGPSAGGSSAGGSLAGEPPGPAELTLRADEAGRLPLPGRRVIIVENEITYLALPALPDALAVLGGGYGVAGLAGLGWLPEREVHYWGDLDTHGFAILDAVRTFLPGARSLLMDRATLEGHRDHWGAEPSPVRSRLERLSESEHALYTDLVEDRYAPALRLEQERIRFGAVREAFAELG